MATYYIDIDSSFRNRTIDPNPGAFQIPIATASSTTSINDPVCLSAPIISWTCYRFWPGNIQNYVSGVVTVNKSTSNILYIQGSFQKMTNYYRGAVLELSGNINRRITSYTYINSGYGRFEIDGSIQNFAAGLNVKIYDSSDFSNPSALEMFVPGGLELDEYFTNLFLFNENHQDFRVISRYFGISSIIETNSATNPAISWGMMDNYSIRVQLPALVSQVGSATTNQIQLLNGSQTTPSVLQSSYIRQTQQIYGNEKDANFGVYSRIVNWDPTTLIVTVSPPFPQPPSFACEILPISTDNATSFVNIHSAINSGTIINFSLIHISLPFVPLATKSGGNIRNYPYVYVVLSNISSSMPKFNFASNNPNATSVQFRATPTQSSHFQSFAKFSGDGTIQSLQLNPNDSLYFSVLFPDGSVWNSIDEDTQSPQSPNPLLQIAAFFSYQAQIKPESKNSTPREVLVSQ